MASNFDFPSNSPMLDPDGTPTVVWSQVMSRWHRIITAAAQSGTTANRPTAYLWIGRPFFDTTLGKPVWVKDPTAVPAVWVDATGTPV